MTAKHSAAQQVGRGPTDRVGASDSPVAIARLGLEVMRIFASILAAQLSNRPGQPITSAHVKAHHGPPDPVAA